MKLDILEMWNGLRFSYVGVDWEVFWYNSGHYGINLLFNPPHVFLGEKLCIDVDYNNDVILFDGKSNIIKTKIFETFVD